MSDEEASPGPSERRNIAGVRLAPGGRTIECDADALTLAYGELVVVDVGGRDGRRASVVASVSVPSASRPVRGPLARVLRRADERDRARLEALQRREAEALTLARELARARGLPMKVFRAEIPQAQDRALFYFSSEQRVDFRELVRDLSGQLRGRIELRQVGVRDEAKMVGGIGSCGLTLCCTTFLPQFAPVSIKMAKNQNLVLNPTKVSGQCGRLKCCLVYEDAVYVEARKGLPRVGKPVETPQGAGRVQDLDILGGMVRVSFPDRPLAVFSAAEVRLAAAPVAHTGDNDPDESPSDPPAT